MTVRLVETGPARCPNCQAAIWRYPVWHESTLPAARQRVVRWDETTDGRWILRDGRMERLSGRAEPGEFRPHRCDGEESMWA